MLRPVPVRAELNQPALHRTLTARFTVIGGGIGTVASDNVALLLDSAGLLQRSLWLRLDRFDDRPDQLWDSLLSAGAHAGVLLDESEGSRPHGPDLGRRLAALVEGDAVIVLEDTSGSGRLPRHAGAVLESYVRSSTTRAPAAIYVRHGRLTRGLRRAADLAVDRADLSGRHVVVTDLIRDVPIDIDLPTLTRLAKLTKWRRALLTDVLEVGASGNRRLLYRLVWTSTDLRSLLDRLTQERLDSARPQLISALGDAVKVGYWHAAIGGIRIDRHELRPWLMPLEESWWWLRPWWRRPLVRYFERRSRGPERATFEGVAFIPSSRLGSPEVTRRDTEARSVRHEPPATNEPASEHTLDATLFGPFELMVDGCSVEHWSGRLGVAILEYLLMQDAHACSQDRLLDMFWPDVDPNRAKNRLHVAVSSLRRDVRSVTDEPVIEFERGTYQLSDRWVVRTDVNRFRVAFRRGRELEGKGDIEGALDRYERALALYRDDLLADAPYDEWTTHPREVLRIAHLDCIDRTATLHLAEGRHDDAVRLADKLLDLDPTREDAYRLLMQCYAAQGRIQQALDQFELCRTVLRRELDLEPSEETASMQRLLLDRARSQ